MPHRLLVALACGVGLVALASDRGTAVADDGATLAVTIDAVGDDFQDRAMTIASRYAPEGSFALELATQTTVSTNGEDSSESSTVVVFNVVGNVDEVVDLLWDEPHVLEVVERPVAHG